MRIRRKVFRSVVVVRTDVTESKATAVCPHLHTTVTVAVECGSARLRELMRSGPVIEAGFWVEQSSSRHMWFPL